MIYLLLFQLLTGFYNNFEPSDRLSIKRSNLDHLSSQYYGTVRKNGKTHRIINDEGTFNLSLTLDPELSLYSSVYRVKIRVGTEIIAEIDANGTLITDSGNPIPNPITVIGQYGDGFQQILGPDVLPTTSVEVTRDTSARTSPPYTNFVNRAELSEKVYLPSGDIVIPVDDISKLETFFESGVGVMPDGQKTVIIYSKETSGETPEIVFSFNLIDGSAPGREKVFFRSRFKLLFERDIRIVLSDGSQQVTIRKIDPIGNLFLSDRRIIPSNEELNILNPDNRNQFRLPRDLYPDHNPQLKAICLTTVHL